MSETPAPLTIPANGVTSSSEIPAAPQGSGPQHPQQSGAPAPVPSPTAVSDTIGAADLSGLDGTIAARLRAKHETIRKGTEEFAIPGWDGELVLVARVIRDRKLLESRGGLTNEQFVIEATQRVLYVDAGEQREIPDGWAGVGRLMGLEGGQVTTGEIVRTILDNPLRLDAFATQLVAWMTGRRSELEQVLGE